MLHHDDKDNAVTFGRLHALICSRSSEIDIKEEEKNGQLPPEQTSFSNRDPVQFLRVKSIRDEQKGKTGSHVTGTGLCVCVCV